jgi:AraC-like DNA-binding protein
MTQVRHGSTIGMGLVGAGQFMSRIAVHSGIPRVNYETSELLAPAIGSEIAGFEASDWQPYPQRQGKRLSAPAVDRTASVGFTDIVEAGDGLHVVITDWPADASRTPATWAETVPEQCGYLYIGLEGDGRLEVEGLGRARRLGPSCSITIAPPGSTFLWRTDPGVARRGVCIPFHARYLRRRYPDLLARCATTLGPWLANEETGLRDFEVPLLPVMTAATAALLSTRLEGQSRLIFVSASAEQLLCLAVAALPGLSSGIPQLSHRDRQIVQRVRTIIDENLTDPPRVEDLARDFGINRTKLRLGFKEVFGVSAAAYLFEQRMRVAFDLLEHDHHSVSEVAARVGYAHLCNFTTSFKRRFGRAPSKIAVTRRRSAG